MEKKLTYGVWAVRSSTSIFGPAQSWCKEMENRWNLIASRC